MGQRWAPRGEEELTLPGRAYVEQTTRWFVHLCDRCVLFVETIVIGPTISTSSQADRTGALALSRDESDLVNMARSNPIKGDAWKSITHQYLSVNLSSTNAAKPDERPASVCSHRSFFN